MGAALGLVIEVHNTVYDRMAGAKGRRREVHERKKLCGKDVHRRAGPQEDDEASVVVAVERDANG